MSDMQQFYEWMSQENKQIDFIDLLANLTKVDVYHLRNIRPQDSWTGW